MESIAVSVPSEVMFDTKMDLEQTKKFVNQTVALEYYKNGISLGYCAEIANMSKEDSACAQIKQNQQKILSFLQKTKHYPNRKPKQKFCNR